MPLYEFTYLVRQDLTQGQIDELNEDIQTTIKEGGGTIVRMENWGSKSLAYRMNKNRRATFLHFALDTPHAPLAEVERKLGLNEDVLRFLTIKVTSHSDEPSAMMQKRDRDDRRPRREGGGPPRENRTANQPRAESA